MLLTSEGERVKLVTAPKRDRRYVVFGYTKLMMESTSIPIEAKRNICAALVDLCLRGPGEGFHTAGLMHSDAGDELMVDQMHF